MFLLYAGTLGNQPVWDDHVFIGGWTAVKSFAHLPDLLRGANPPGHAGVYRPLRGIVYALDYALFGGDFLWYRIQAIVVHVICVLLVYGLTLRLSGRAAIAAVTALLFGVHPTHVESITFTTSSLDTFGAIWLLAAVLLYVEARRRPQPAVWLGLSLACGVAGFLTDELTYSLPFLLVLVEWLSGGTDRRRLAGTLPWFGAAAAAMFVRFFLVQVGTRGRYLGGSVGLHALAAIKAFALSVSLVLVPLRLNVDHTISPGIEAYAQLDEAVRSQSPLDPPVLAALAFVVLVAGIAAACARREPLATFAIGWMCVCLLPAANLFPQAALLRERYLFLPSYGGCLLVATAAGWAWQAAAGRFRGLTRLAVATAVTGYAVACGVSTLQLNRAWHDEESLWEFMFAVNPHSDMTCFNVATVRTRAGKTAAAFTAYEAALRANPRNVAAIVNIGSIQSERGLDADALAAFQAALVLKPDHALAHSNLGTLHARAGRTELAAAAFRRAIDCQPSFLAAHCNLGSILLSKHRWAEAVRVYEHALRTCGTFPGVYAGLAEAYEGLGDREKAAAARARLGSEDAVD